MPKEETSEFVPDLFWEDILAPDFPSFIPLAFSIFFFGARLDSPELTLERSLIYLEDPSEKWSGFLLLLILTPWAPFGFLRIYTSTSLS